MVVPLAEVSRCTFQRIFKKRGIPSLLKDKIPLCISFLPSIRYATQATVRLSEPLSERSEGTWNPGD